mgnify:CR=1 FL=1
MIDIEQFNKPNSDIFIYILCTRAGGLGVNLQVGAGGGAAGAAAAGGAPCCGQGFGRVRGMLLTAGRHRWAR